ncbi:hypothetical protein M0802_002017 [Mischocyttarus mexicanus]|nr:hypothetical protein M0802_002017 [Mischocyttarus mexicanus]
MSAPYFLKEPLEDQHRVRKVITRFEIGARYGGGSSVGGGGGGGSWPRNFVLHLVSLLTALLESYNALIINRDKEQGVARHNNDEEKKQKKKKKKEEDEEDEDNVTTLRVRMVNGYEHLDTGYCGSLPFASSTPETILRTEGTILHFVRDTYPIELLVILFLLLYSKNWATNSKSSKESNVGFENLIGKEGTGWTV